MTVLLEHALEALVPFVPSLDAEKAIERVDVSKTGTLSLSLRDEEGDRWFEFDDRGLIERSPQSDARIPLSKRLAPSDRVLAYRPGRRLVVSRSDGTPAIHKGYRKSRSREALRRYEIALSGSGSGSGGPGFRFPRVLSYGRDAATIELERLAGDPLRIDGESVETFFAIGAHLKTLQGHDAPHSLDDHDVHDELAVVDAWRARIRRVGHPLPGGWPEARDLAERLASKLRRGPFVLCHRDLHDGQFLVQRSEVALLDADLLCIADAALDPANLLAHLTLRALQGLHGATGETSALCGEAFLEGYELENERSFWPRLRLYEALAFLRLALLYSLRPRWRSLGEPLTGLAIRCLDDVEGERG